MELHFSVLARQQCAIVWAGGQCDRGNEAQLRRYLDDVLVSNSARMVLDLSALTVPDDTWIDVMTALGQRAQELGGSLMITAGPALELDDLDFGPLDLLSNGSLTGTERGQLPGRPHGSAHTDGELEGGLAGGWRPGDRLFEQLRGVAGAPIPARTC